MAFLINNIFGRITGSLGDKVFRFRYGKTIAYKKPVKQKVSKSIASTQARKQFALTVALAKKINSIPALAAIWRNAKIPGTSAYHKIIKHNNKLTSVDSLTVNNIILPKGGYFSITGVSRIEDKITISFANDFNELLKNFDYDINLVVIIYLYKKRQWLTPEFMLFDHIVSIKVQDAIYDVGVDLTSLNIPFKKYNNSIFYAAVLFNGGDTKMKRYSNTFARAMEND